MDFVYTLEYLFMLRKGIDIMFSSQKKQSNDISANIKKIYISANIKKSKATIL